MSVTHRTFRCPACETEILLPIEIVRNTRSIHREKLYCECKPSLPRIEMVRGEEGKARLP